ncbi:MAG: sulfate adenylyltransferase [gamma proteobacterium symbiont of Phacoides pectinatus]
MDAGSDSVSGGVPSGRARAAARLLLLWLLLCGLAAGLLLAQEIGLSAGVIEGVERKYGAEARRRVESWKRLMEEKAGLGEREKLELVNDFFNRLPYYSDWRLWGKEDYWATPIEALGKHGADCEDYSIAKYFTLRALGVAEEKMRITYVKALELNEAHMVLTYYKTPGAVPLVLDNLKKRILSADRRKDLAPVYSFNADGLWLAKSLGQGKKVGSSSRINLWQQLKQRMAEELER